MPTGGCWFWLMGSCDRLWQELPPHPSSTVPASLPLLNTSVLLGSINNSFFDSDASVLRASDITKRWLQTAWRGHHEPSKSSRSASEEWPRSSFPKHGDSPLAPAALFTVFGANKLLSFTFFDTGGDPHVDGRTTPAAAVFYMVMYLRPKHCTGGKSVRIANKSHFPADSFCTNYYAKVFAAYFLLNFCMNKGCSVHILRSILEKVSLIIFNAVDF